MCRACEVPFGLSSRQMIRVPGIWGAATNTWEQVIACN